MGKKSKQRTQWHKEVRNHGTFCEVCGTSEGLHRCAGCDGASYCSKEHQRLHWPNHKEMCVTKSKPVGPDPMAGWSLLHKATFHGDHKLVKRLLTGGIDKNSTTPGGSAMSMGGNTAVNFAALAGHYAICRTLVGAGADLEIANSGSATPLFSACASGHADIVKLLVREGVNLDRPEHGGGYTPLMISVQHGRPDIVEFLCGTSVAKNLVNKEGATALCLSVLQRQSTVAPDLTIMRTLLDGGAAVDHAENRGFGFPTPLREAAQNGQLGAVKMLLCAGAQVNHMACNPLQSAAGNGHTQVVKTLIEAGAIVTRGDPLSHAALSDHAETVRVLVKAGCNMNTGVAEAPLLSCCQMGKNKAAVALIELGAAVNITNPNGGTPLYIGAMAGHSLEVVMALVRAGADVVESYQLWERLVPVFAREMAAKQTSLRRPMTMFDMIEMQTPPSPWGRGQKAKNLVVAAAISKFLKKVYVAGGWRKWLAGRRANFVSIRNTVAVTRAVASRECDPELRGVLTFVFGHGRKNEEDVAGLEAALGKASLGEDEKPATEEERLRSMSIKQLKAAARGLDLSTAHCFEKSDIVELLLTKQRPGEAAAGRAEAVVTVTAPDDVFSLICRYAAE